jgi:hypothetical protein
MEAQDKKMMDALIADRMGIEEAEAAYAEVKNQIAVTGQRFPIVRLAHGDCTHACPART